LTPEDIPEIKQASVEIRKLASQLRSTMWTIPLYWLFALLGIVPQKSAIKKASTGLIGYSNSLGDGHSKSIHRDAIAAALKIDWK
jgi:hypothetical protein